MEPYKAKELPFEYNLDKEMFILVAEANAKYGEDSRLFLASNFCR